MARFEVEIMRSNVTVGQFLSYVRAQLKKRGLGAFTGSLDYDNFVGGNGWDAKVYHKELNDSAYAALGIEYEEVRDLPYNKKSYQRKANGVASNEIVEFEFDNGKTGRGYYYLVDGEDEAESVESTADTAAVTEAETEPESVGNAENGSCNAPEQEDNADLTDEPIAGVTCAGEPVTLEAIAHEFAAQEKGYDEMWSYNNRGTNDCLVQYWYTWYDEYGRMDKDHVDIFLSDACRSAGVDFDVVDDGDIEGRMLEEMVDRGYTVDDDNEIVIDDGADEYAICEEMDEIRSDLWEQADDEAARARDELCDHEDLSEPWFRELVEEMYTRVKASIEKDEI